MKVGKPKSKRVPVRLRHKIQKASNAKQRKTRKEAKKNPEWKSRMKKDPGIPNLFPYKDKILAEVEEGRRRKEEEAQKRRELAKAQRTGAVVAEKTGASAAAAAVEDEEILEDAAEEDLEDDDDEEMDDGSSNPMAALLASAQARANAYGKDGLAEESEEDSVDEANGEEWGGIDTAAKEKASQPTRKALPKQALADPIKAVSALLERLEQTQDGIQQMLNFYQIPPLVTAGSDTTSRFLVDVARKRGRLGRGGIPNLHSAALTVLSDINDERLRLPSLAAKPAAQAASGKGDVQIVSQMAEPFRIEGLFE